MTYQFQHSANNSQVGIKPEQLDEIITAILAGKYSWACFLLLRCTGYNPLDYIPYRTSNRLLKENSQAGKTDIQSGETKAGKSKISDLDHLEVVQEKRSTLKGGYVARSVNELSAGATGFVAECDRAALANIEALPVENRTFFTGLKLRLFNAKF
ncbi:MAG: HetP family heterocyst commitment protein [Microcoleus sp.]